MHPEIERQLAAEMARELRRAGAAARIRAVPHAVEDEEDVVIRRAREQDACALRALAILDSAEPPLGATLVAEVRGSIVAALPLDGGGPFADPFRRTADLVALLEARAKQVAGERRRSGHARLAWLTPAALRRLV